MYTTINRGREGCFIRGLVIGRGRRSHAGIEKHATSIKENTKSGLFKALVNTVFAYGEEN